MQTTDVQAIEIAKWDALASVATADDEPMVAHADFGAYAREDATMVGIAEFVGDLRGREVLELGSVMAEMTTLLARGGAHVTAVVISPASIALGGRRARLHRVEAAIDFVVAAGEQLPFEPGRFDVVVGKAVLHHLDVGRAAPELHRVLCPRGRAAFAEPLGTNPDRVRPRPSPLPGQESPWRRRSAELRRHPGVGGTVLRCQASRDPAAGDGGACAGTRADASAAPRGRPAARARPCTRAPLPLRDQDEGQMRMT